MKLGRLLVAMMLSGMVLLAGMTGAAFAAEEETAAPMGTGGGNWARILPGNPDWCMAIGYKAWIADWKTTSYVPLGAYSGESLKKTSSQLASIPTLSLRWKNFFVSASYFTETNYNFNNTRISSYFINNGTPVLAEIDHYNYKGKRTEWDVNVGYYLWSSVALTIGYKSIDMDFSYNYESTFAILDDPIIIQHDSGSAKRSKDFEGPVVGLSASQKIKWGLGFYGFGGYGWLDADGGDGVKGDADYFLAELGLTYKHDKWPLALQAGYRIQSIDVDWDHGGGSLTDLTKGVVFSANLIF